MSDKEEFDQAINSLEASEDLGETEEAPISDAEPDNPIEKPKKARKKRVLSDKQKLALKRGREKRMEKLKAKKQEKEEEEEEKPKQYNLRKRPKKKKKAKKKPEVVYMTESSDEESSDDGQIQRPKPVHKQVPKAVVEESETVRKNRRHGHFYLDDE